MSVFTNPLTENDSPDPAVVFYEGYYYAVTSSGKRGTALSVMKARRLQDLYRAGPVQVYSTQMQGRYACDLWAPELWHLDGGWYIYTCAADGVNNHTHRIIVLKGTHPQEPFEFSGVLELGDFYSIDASVLNAPNGKRYLLWSASKEKEQDNPCQMYMAEMESPVKMKEPGRRFMIREASYPWEGRVIEGPACLIRNGVVTVVYSSNAFDRIDYCLGMMNCRNADEADFRKWRWDISDKPVFASTGKVWGPGHNTFTVSPDGTETWIVYHSKVVSEPNYRRRANAQKIEWENDVPVLGIPVDPGAAINTPSGTGIF